MDLEDFKIDLDAAVNGKWYTMAGDLEFKIARLHNEKYELLFARLKGELEEEFGTGNIPKKETQDMAGLCIACLIMDWKGMKIEGKTAKYDSDMAIKIMQDLAYSDISNFIMMKANGRANFVAKRKAKAKKS